MRSEQERFEYSFLQAGHALVQAQRELVPQLAETLGVAPGEVFYSWMDREFPNVAPSPHEGWRLQTGELPGTGWRYFFHGLECDLGHRDDGRHVRVEFGPHGRYDLLAPFAVLQFVMSSAPPWPEFPELKAYLAAKPPPYHQYSGSHERATELWGRLEAQGYLEAADPVLAALVERSTVRLPSGCSQIRLPDDFTDRQRLDCMVCERQVLSAAALRLLEREATH